MGRNILICLEKLGIGGVETAVFNYALELNKNNKVIIMAQDGIYKEVLERNNIKVINFNYEIKDYIDLKQTKTIENILEKNNISEVHIHQLPCIQYLIPILISKNIPYISFIHSNIKGSYEWFSKNYNIYTYLIPLYFKNANKIITITESAYEEINTLYNLNSKKNIILKNSICLDFYKSKKTVNRISKFLLISRFAKEKRDSIYSAIDYFIEIQQRTNRPFFLDIIGDGELKEDIKSKIKGQNNIKLLPATNDVKAIMDSYDVILGMGRCILEAIAMKKIPIIVGYNKCKNIIKKNNIELANIYNFSGNNFNENNISSIELVNLSSKQIKKIIEDNYKFISENLNISNNIKYLDVNLEETSNYNLNEFELINEIASLKKRILDIEKAKYLSEQKLYKENEKIYTELKTQTQYNEKIISDIEFLKQEKDSIKKIIIKRIKKLFSWRKK